jgi:hypothetical protein
LVPAKQRDDDQGFAEARTRIVEQTGAAFEAKFMLPWAFTEEAAEKYMAQLQHITEEHHGELEV